LELDKPDIVPIQETMGKGDQLTFELKKSLRGCDFLALDSKGFSRGLITG
jgi:hypothetical protein